MTSERHESWVFSLFPRPFPFQCTLRLHSVRMLAYFMKHKTYPLKLLFLEGFDAYVMKIKRLHNNCIYSGTVTAQDIMSL